MTSDRDIERVLDRWFAERPAQVADRVLDEVADRIARQSQPPAWRLPWRDSHVNSYLKPLLAVAAVVVIAVAGIAYLGQPSRSGVGGAGSPALSPSPSASALPSVAPSAGAVLPPWYSTSETPTGAGILPAGSQTTQSFNPAFTFSVPEGWVNDTDDRDYYGLFPDTPANEAEFAASGLLANGILMGYPPGGSPYFVCDAWEDHQGTAAEVAASIAANDALATSEPIDVTIGGMTGKQIDVQLDPEWTESCPGEPPGTDLGDQRTRGILLDTQDRGVIVMFVGSSQPDGHEAFLAEAMPIIESFEFDLTP
jgi:hypothetical protein